MGWIDGLRPSIWIGSPSIWIGDREVGFAYIDILKEAEAPTGLPMHAEDPI